MEEMHRARVRVEAELSRCFWASHPSRTAGKLSGSQGPRVFNRVQPPAPPAPLLEVGGRAGLKVRTLVWVWREHSFSLVSSPFEALQGPALSLGGMENGPYEDLKLLPPLRRFQDFQGPCARNWGQRPNIVLLKKKKTFIFIYLFIWLCWVSVSSLLLACGI